MCSTQIWLERLEDMWTGESQPVGESVLAHDGFFLRSFVKLLSWRHVRWLAHMVFLVSEVMGTHVWCILVDN